MYGVLEVWSSAKADAAVVIIEDSERLTTKDGEAILILRVAVCPEGWR